MTRVPSKWLRKIHKWVGLVIGLQVVLWAFSGLGMALLDMDEVAGGPSAEHAPGAVPNSAAWPIIQQAAGNLDVSAIRVRTLADRPVMELAGPSGPLLFDATSGVRMAVGAPMAAAIAAAAHPEGRTPQRVQALKELDLAVRDHELPIWRADFDDSRHSSYYVSGTTGELLERRNDSWRWWDFWWMLHSMDYAKRTSFNHPLIVLVAFACAWLAVTGFWLLFRTSWRFRLKR